MSATGCGQSGSWPQPWFTIGGPCRRVGLVVLRLNRVGALGDLAKVSLDHVPVLRVHVAREVGRCLGTLLGRQLAPHLYLLLPLLFAGHPVTSALDDAAIARRCARSRGVARL